MLTFPNQRLALLFAMAVCAPAMGCLAEDIASGERLRFGALFDAYQDAAAPSWESLAGGSWKLIASAPVEEDFLGLATDLDRSGLLVNDSVPRLAFVPRSKLDVFSEASLLSWSSSDRFVRLLNWGKTLREVSPSSVQLNPDWRDQHPLSAKCATFSMRLFDTNEPLFSMAQQTRQLSSYVQYHCRIIPSRHLVCMGEVRHHGTVRSTIDWVDEDTRSRSGQIGFFLLFENERDS